MKKYTEGDYLSKIRELNRAIGKSEANRKELKKWLERIIENLEKVKH